MRWEMTGRMAVGCGVGIVDSNPRCSPVTLSALHLLWTVPPRRHCLCVLRTAFQLWQHLGMCPFDIGTFQPQNEVSCHSWIQDRRRQGPSAMYIPGKYYQAFGSRVCQKKHFQNENLKYFGFPVCIHLVRKRPIDGVLESGGKIWVGDWLKPFVILFK